MLFFIYPRTMYFAIARAFEFVALFSRLRAIVKNIARNVFRGGKKCAELVNRSIHTAPALSGINFNLQESAEISTIHCATERERKKERHVGKARPAERGD